VSATVCKYDEDGENVSATIRLPVSDEEQMVAWLDNYQRDTKTTSRKSRTYPNVGRKLTFKVIAFSIFAANYNVVGTR